MRQLRRVNQISVSGWLTVFFEKKAILSILNYWGRAGKNKNICDFSPFFVFFSIQLVLLICWYATNNKDDEIGYSPLPGCLLPQYVLLWLSLPPSLRNSTHQYFSFLRRIIHNFTNQCSEDYFFLLTQVAFLTWTFTSQSWTVGILGLKNTFWTFLINLQFFMLLSWWSTQLVQGANTHNIGD